MTDEELGQWDGVDETTASRERRDAETSARMAVDGAIRTGGVIAQLRAAISDSRELHQKNNYVPRLRQIFRGAA